MEFNADQLRLHVGEKVISILKSEISAQRLEARRAQQIAQFFIEKFPVPLSLESIPNVLEQLAAGFPELKPVSELIRSAVHEHHKDVIAKRASELIANNKTDEAISILKNQQI